MPPYLSGKKNLNGATSLASLDRPKSLQDIPNTPTAGIRFTGYREGDVMLRDPRGFQYYSYSSELLNIMGSLEVSGNTILTPMVYVSTGNTLKTIIPAGGPQQQISEKLWKERGVRTPFVKASAGDVVLSAGVPATLNLGTVPRTNCLRGTLGNCFGRYGFSQFDDYVVDSLVWRNGQFCFDRSLELPSDRIILETIDPADLQSLRTAAKSLIPILQEPDRFEVDTSKLSPLEPTSSDVPMHRCVLTTEDPKVLIFPTPNHTVTALRLEGFKVKEVDPGPYRVQGKFFSTKSDLERCVLIRTKEGQLHNLQELFSKRCAYYV